MASLLVLLMFAGLPNHSAVLAIIKMEVKSNFFSFFATLGLEKSSLSQEVSVMGRQGCNMAPVYFNFGAANVM